VAYLGKQYKEDMSVVAETISFGLSKKVSNADFHAMYTAINANMSQQHGIKHHMNDFCDRRMFEIDTDLEAKVAKKVVESVQGILDYVKPVSTEHECSQDPEKITYRQHDPAKCVAVEVVGLVA
jgi:hypothetical protein